MNRPDFKNGRMLGYETQYARITDVCVALEIHDPEQYSWSVDLSEEERKHISANRQQWHGVMPHLGQNDNYICM